ncbi:MAG: HlyC/CorC family transporter [Burkholderiales bacterium]|nr:HlyC/CorC family transporter [Burkholderiales bacterium]
MDDIPLSALLIALGVLLVVSAFFSISEISMMSLNRYRLRHLVQHGHRGAARAADLLAQTDKLLGVILLGNNLVNAMAAALVTIIAVRFFGNSEFAITIATLAVTFLILVFSEISPKVMGAAYPEQVAFPASYVLKPLIRLFYPIIWFVNLFVQGLLRLLRLRPSEAQQHKISMPELRTLVMEASGFIPKKHQSVLLNLFELESITVDDVMTPRSQIEAIDIEADEETIWRQLTTSHHTQLPVYQGELNNIIGIVHTRKVLHQAQGEPITLEALKQILREPYFIPVGTPLLTQLQNFQENQRKFGIVVDEYGELQGLVKVEDILEEIVGEFTTRSPLHSANFRVQEDGSWLIDGSSSLRELNRKLDTKFPLDGPKTLNGLVLEYFEDIPEAGTSFRLADHTLEVVQTQDRVVKVVRLYPPAPEVEITDA